MTSIRLYLTVGVLALLFLGLGELFAHQQYDAFKAEESPPATCPAGAHDLNYFRVIVTIAITYILVTPALCLFAYRVPREPMGAWLAFWTASYATYLVHVYWAISGMMGGQWHLVFECPHLVNHPWNDTLLTFAWGLDVILAWVVVGSQRDIWQSPRWVRAFRGFVHLWLFAALTGVWISKAENWYIRGLGFFMTVAVLVCAIGRLVIKPFDSNSLGARLYVGLFKVINMFVPWHRLPTYMAVVNLGAYRETLRAKNLCNTSDVPITNEHHVAKVPKYDPRYLMERQVDGYYDDLSKPSMGGASTNTESVAPEGSSAQATHDSMYFTISQPGARFGRNVPLSEAHPDLANLLNPNPRLISDQLLARDSFKPATILNLLAAAWIQFQTHDWFNHGEPLWEGEREDKNRRNEKDPFTKEQYQPHLVPIPDGDRWLECPMRIRPTRPDPTRDYEREKRANSGRLKYPPTYANAESHWWDGSQIYGSDDETLRRLRSDYKTDSNGNLVLDDQGHLIPTGEQLPDGKLFLTREGLSLDPSTGTALSGFTGNWWLGLALMHTLFTREHNAICDAIRREYPLWTSDEVFRVARLVNAALIAKTHTIEWTPAILSHPALKVGMNANWWGLLSEQVKKAFGRISRNEAFSGIPGSGVDHGISVDSGIPGLPEGQVADYCLTEEFVSVYRLHPLVPDELEVLSARHGRLLKKYVLPQGVVGDESRLTALNDGATMGDLLYSFGVANPGAVTLHNYPNFLRNLKRPAQFGVEEVVDLASIDILRDRERGVPRYNRFLRLFHRTPISSFDDFKNPDFPTLGADLRRIYGQTPDGRDNVELLDLMVGMFAEVPPKGFGFSDTAFRVFILMASRRLKSERFIAGDAFIPDVYTQVGLDWLENTSMSDILVRHYPELGPSLYGVKNAFAPWNRIAEKPSGAGSGRTS
jgi:hypothetical protein